MIRRPPRSTLFPTRRSSDLDVMNLLTSSTSPRGRATLRRTVCDFLCFFIAHIVTRSEEHTSELQSRPHLVCRLLLEKKASSSDATNHVPTSITPSRPRHVAR